ncbi:oxidoreductase [Micromonospora carbonacea]|uniref:NAD-binding protein n=1 Tax=Micromonospora carbonacea TaxID=47853 RepID=A0A7H8XKV7_9ACTN|nr:FAD-dependent oxidoreductase [Micromonospora carbonacea]MBB5826062.1 2,4-dienoyl-CoA reductase-like NADH-dependent reductase (Old Yellow Enzyme family) [Micromonospora carbonacea]QLD25637.1 NAD-binding protein [Micromonospora carbonacea]
MADEKLRKLLSPVRLASLTLRNRVFVPGHTTNFGLHNEPTARLAAYHAERARGGAGLIITEAIRVHPTSAGRSISLGAFTDASVPAYQRVTDAVHAHGARIFAQVMHAGRQANGDATRTAAWSSSPVAWAAGAHVPHAMGRRDLATVVDAFAAAARRMRRAGFDGLEVHAGHGHLLQQFLSPHTNRRADDYGGSLANRMRLTHEVLAAVHAAVADLPVGLRISADEFLPGGLDPDAMVEIVTRLRAEHPLAYVHVSHSAYHGSWSLATQMADMSFGHAPFRHHAARFSREFPDLPVLAVCRLDSLPEAAELIAAGEADLVGLARPHIADPHLVRKAAAGRQHETRSCLACNQGCIARVEASLPITCVVNPEVGVEREWASARRRHVPARRVLVVGGGPAGLAAATAARRAGHRVTLAEAADDLGGQVRVAARVPGRERLGLLTRDLAAEARAAGVELLLGHRVTAAGARDGGYDDVVVATGSRPARRALPGGPPVLDLWQAVDLLAAPDAGGGTYVVLDDDGTWAASSVAEALARRGARVHLVSPTASLAARITTYSRLALLRRFTELGVVVHPLRTPRVVDGGTIALTGPLAGVDVPVDDVTAVVDAGAPAADDTLFRHLDAAPDGPRIHLVGDANAPRTTLEAVYEGRYAGAFLGRHDSPDAAAVALAY